MYSFIKKEQTFKNGYILLQNNLKMSGIAGKRALVTGGGSGIGLAIARKLMENGAAVYIMGRNKEKLNNAVKESGNKLHPIQCDVSDWAETRKVIKNILPIQLLVKNAGVLISESVSTFSENSYNSTMNINLKGPINLTQFVTNDLLERKLAGNVVNISSILAEKSIEGLINYCCSKAALDMATKCFALELGSKNIRVNSVNPTAITTDMTADMQVTR